MGLKQSAALQKAQSSLGRLLSFVPLSPNQITALSLLFALAGFCLSYLQLPLHSLLLFALAGAMDAVDGAVARARGQSSAKGAYIDGMIDRLVEFLLVCSFFFYPLPDLIAPPAASLMAILFFGSAMTAFSVAYAGHRGVGTTSLLSRPPGILPRAERLLLLFAALALIPYSFAACSFVLLCAAALSLLTFLQRFFAFAA